ncbi:MAG: hypothetical protein HQK86_03430 [Nitrospinae bacterium]|nr:hypothetical protein [Nitrospinota bacterium]
MSSPYFKLRPPIMLMGMLSLIAGLIAGLQRLGMNVPLGAGHLPEYHGPLMICGFLGTVIGLERSVALGRLYAYAAPALTGVGSLLLVFGVSDEGGKILLTCGSLILAAVFISILRLQMAMATVLMGLAAFMWAVGNVLWVSGMTVPAVTPWWAAFLVLTISGERLELSRLLQLTRSANAAFLLAVGVFVSGVALTVVAPLAGLKIMGIGMIGLALWLGTHDIARHTIKMTGLTRFVAVCLLTGYFWLGVSGVMTFFVDGLGSGPMYDAMLHALFLGFVFAMIFGHAPIIFPAVLEVAVPYTPAFYAHLIVLEISLLARVASDVGGISKAVAHAGALNEAALILFLLNTVTAVVRGKLGK